MSLSTLLISEYLMIEYPELRELKGVKLRDCLHRLMQDPDLWRKVRVLESKKFTKTYQPEGLSLNPVRFYPFPEDWCRLSVISNGTGFSRCYIFIFLLLFDLGILKLDDVVTIKYLEENKSEAVFCRVKIDKRHRFLRRILKPIQKAPPIRPIINTIRL